VNQVDLHCHTTASDGLLAPAQVVARAARLTLKYLAITDHDSVGGLPEARHSAARYGIEIIPGVEINTDVEGGELHILGYYFSDSDPDLTGKLSDLRQGRISRATSMVARLAEMGITLSLDRVLQLANGGSVGRPHVAQALVESGAAATFSEAFDRFIGRNAPAYVERQRFTPVEACQLIRAAGGLPVYAHPVHYDRHGAIRHSIDLSATLPELIEAGLAGLEVYYPGYDAITVEHLLAATRHYGLVATGGTDFHGFSGDRADIGGVYVPLKVMRRLREAWEKAFLPK
jgi:3',5'-nucleoside bisphosphate phosphatase